jgi:hypothetical protein
MKDTRHAVNRWVNPTQRNRKRGSENDQRISFSNYTCLLQPFLNRYILTLPIKTPGLMSLHGQKEIIHYNEMNDQIFNIDIDLNI